MNTPNLTREEWAKELVRVNSTWSPVKAETSTLRIIDAITRQAKIEALENMSGLQSKVRYCTGECDCCNEVQMHIAYEINRLKEGKV